VRCATVHRRNLTPAAFRLDEPALVDIIKTNKNRVFRNTQGDHFVCLQMFSHLDEEAFPGGLDAHPNCDLRAPKCVLKLPITAPTHLEHNHPKDGGASDAAQDFDTVWQWLVAISERQDNPATALPVNVVRYRARLWFAQRYLISGKVCRSNGFGLVSVVYLFLSFGLTQGKRRPASVCFEALMSTLFGRGKTAYQPGTDGYRFSRLEMTNNGWIKDGECMASAKEDMECLGDGMAVNHTGLCRGCLLNKKRADGQRREASPPAAESQWAKKGKHK